MRFVPKFVKNLLDGTSGDTAQVQVGKDPRPAATLNRPQTSAGVADWRRDETRERGFFSFREPDGPFHHHHFRPRTETLPGLKVPKILISDHAYRRMCLIVETAPKEVGWLGTVDRLASGNFFIDEVFVPEQEVSGSETDPTDEGQFNVMNELVEMGEEGMKKIERLRFWGHSHVHMGTSPSGTDENTPLNYQRLGLPWFIRGIFNKFGRAEFTVYLFAEGYRFIDVPWDAVDVETRDILRIQHTERRERGNLRTETSGSDLGLTDRECEFEVQEELTPTILPAKLVPSIKERRQVKEELDRKLRNKRFRLFGDFDDEERPWLRGAGGGSHQHGQQGGSPIENRQRTAGSGTESSGESSRRSSLTQGGE